MLLRLDHLVLTVSDLSRSLAFYQEVLGMRHELFGEGRHALCFGQQKINLHLHGHEFEPKAAAVQVGSADLCLITDWSLATLQEHLAALQVPVEQGPVLRTGALGPIESLCLRDPDGNLLEISRYL